MLSLLFIFITDHLVFGIHRIFIPSVCNSHAYLHFLYRLWKSCGSAFVKKIILQNILTELGHFKFLNMSL